MKKVIACSIITISVIISGCSMKISDTMIPQYTLNKSIQTEIAKQAEIKNNIDSYRSQVYTLINLDKNDTEKYEIEVKKLDSLSEKLISSLIIENNRIKEELDSFDEEFSRRETEQAEGGYNKAEDPEYKEYELRDKNGELIGVTSDYEYFKEYQRDVLGVSEGAIDEGGLSNESSSINEETSSENEVINSEDEPESNIIIESTVTEYTIYNNKIVFKCINAHNKVFTLTLLLDEQGKVAEINGY